jgi:hypothetical protein
MGDELDNELKKIGVPHKKISLSLYDFNNFKAIYKDTRDRIDDQKLLEYYISYYFLDFHQEDVYVDVASQDCPFAFFIKEQFSCKVYRQDLYYLGAGIIGEDIGCDACHIPLENETITKISLHNSFEHFEGNKDIEFINESQRLLKVGGKMVIVPLYIGKQYRENNDGGWIDSNGEKHLWGLGARFSRLYGPKELIQRVLISVTKFNMELYEIENISQFGKNFQGKFFLLFQKLPGKN